MVHVTKNCSDRIWLGSAAEQCHQHYLHTNLLTLGVVFILRIVLIFRWSVVPPKTTASITFSRKVIVYFPSNSIKMPVQFSCTHLFHMTITKKKKKKIIVAKGIGNTGCLHQSGPFWNWRRGLCYPGFIVRTLGTLYLEERRDVWESTSKYWQ